MECVNLNALTKERYDYLMHYYMENNDQSFCARLTYTYVILGMIVRTFEELKTTQVAEIDSFLKFIGLVTMFTDKLGVCGPQTPEAVCISMKKCTGLWCTRAYDMYSPNKVISLLEQYRAEMFDLEYGVNGTLEKLQAMQ